MLLLSENFFWETKLPLFSTEQCEIIPKKSRFVRQQCRGRGAHLNAAGPPELRHGVLLRRLDAALLTERAQRARSVWDPRRTRDTPRGPSRGDGAPRLFQTRNLFLG